MRLTAGRMVARELAVARVSALLSVLGVAVPVGVAVGVWVLGQAHRSGSEQLVKDKEHGTQAMLEALQQDYRAIGGRMPADLLLVSSGADRAAMLTEGVVTATVRADMLDSLAADAQNPFCRLQPRVEGWGRVSGYHGPVRIVGIGADTVLSAEWTGKGEPGGVPATAGFAFVGYEICRECSLAAGMRVSVGAVTLTVAECVAQQGSRSDISVRMGLGDAQRALGLDGRLSSIGAVLRDPSMDAGAVAEAVQTTHAGLQIVWHGATSRARARMGEAARQVSYDVAGTERSAHRTLLLGTSHVLALLLAGAGLCCAAWVGIVTFVNLHRRRAEIGLLTALGMAPSGVAWLFVGRGAVVGLVGAVVGLAVGCAAAGSPEGQAGWAAAATIAVAGAALCLAAHLWVAAVVLRHDTARTLMNAGA